MDSPRQLIIAWTAAIVLSAFAYLNRAALAGSPVPFLGRVGAEPTAVEQAAMSVVQVVALLIGIGSTISVFYGGSNRMRAYCLIPAIVFGFGVYQLLRQFLG